MPPPATANDLLDLIQKSGVTDEAKLRAYVNKLAESSGIPSDPQKLAGLLVRDGLLTYFQAEQLLQGKYKRFTIGKYKVLEKLGAGGMAQVFLCEHKLMRRRVAIKVLPTAKAQDPSSLERFYREARAVAAVDHPNIVRAYDIDQDDNLHFLVMEYVDGTNLQDLVKKIGPLPVPRACHYIYGAAVGLQHAHEMGLVHRDIKPSNILLDRSGVVKILDMGLARFFHDEEDILTKKYDENVLGTADYLAPEQAVESHTVDIRADIYSLGATFYFLLTGSPLFPEGSVAQKLIWHQNREPRPIRSLRPEVPEEIVAIVNKMIAKDREQRYQTPAEVMAALAPWVATPIPPPAEHEMPQLSPAAAGGSSRPASLSMISIGGTLPTVALRTAPAGAGATVTTPPPVSTPQLPPTPGAAPATPVPTVPFTPVPSVPAPVPVVTPPPAAAAAVLPGPPSNPWESLTSDGYDTQRVSGADTEPTGRPPAEPAPASRPARRAGGLPLPLLLIGAGGLLLAAAAGLYFAVFAGRKSEPPAVPPRAADSPPRLLVADGGGDHTYGTLREALSRVLPGGTIIVVKSRLVEPSLRLDRTKHKDVTIEGQTTDGRPPIIEVTTPVPALFDLNSVDGVRIRNLELDGGDKAEYGVQVSGVCPGLVIEGVTVRRVKTAGFRLVNVAGGDSRPVTLDHVRVVVAQDQQVGILMAAHNSDTRRLTLRRSRLEGPGQQRQGTGVRIEGPASELVIRENRFYGLNTGLSLARVPNERPLKAEIGENTWHRLTRGLHFDTTPVGNSPPGRFELTVVQNFFGETAGIAHFDGPVPPVGLVVADNYHGAGCGPGNVTPPLAAPAPKPDLPPSDPENNATFLRFPGGQPEVNGKKIGAP